MILTSEQISIIDEKIWINSHKTVVLLDVSRKESISIEEHNENIFCIDPGKRIIWKVSAPASPHGKDSFVAIEFVNGTLRGERFFGAEYEIDLETGVAKEVGWHK